MNARTWVPVAAGLLLGACTVIPTGPSVMALPGSRKTLEAYQADVADCRRHADAVVAAASGGVASQADDRAAASAATGAVLGAATGALIGGASGNAGRGAAIGAGTGLIFGAAAGAPYAALSSQQLQRGYDRAYLQCMYARGHQVPVARNSSAYPSRPSYVQPGQGYPPPASVPPSNYPPPDAPPPPAVPRNG